VLRASQLDGLRCGSLLREPGGLKEDVVHVWTHDGREVDRQIPTRLPCDGDDAVFVSFLPDVRIPKDPIGKWSCTTFTEGGQLVGVRKFEVIRRTGPEGLPAVPGAGSGSAGSGSAGSGAGSGSAGSAGSAASGAASASGSASRTGSAATPRTGSGSAR
jgi:hypothetical protein